MSDIFTVKMVGDRELIAKFVSMPQKLRDALVRATGLLEAKLEALVKTRYLSGPTGAHTLSVGKNTPGHTGGLLRDSVHGIPIEQSGSSVKGGVGYGAQVPYAAIHEFGGTINIPEIVPVKAQALHFLIGGKEVFVKRVAAHTVVMPERAPLRTAFRSMKAEIIAEYKLAAEGAMGIK
jgi:hypothetical protein